MANLPPVDLVRPARCPSCDAPSRPIGGPLGLHGHGLRERQIRGPLTPGGPAKLVSVLARRYKCLSCRAIVLVVPRGVLPRRLYSAPVIAWVLARVGLEGATTATVRAEVCPSLILGPSAVERWLAPSRWIEARRQGLLFPQRGRSPPTASRKQVAERTAMQFVALAPPSASGLPAPSAAWYGAARAAR
jgi:hypothetical protein